MFTILMTLPPSSVSQDWCNVYFQKVDPNRGVVRAIVYSRK